jgi:acetyltransferase
VVGASSNPTKLGYVLLKNILDYGYKGEIYPVNPSGEEILGYPSYPSISEIKRPVDLALISVPNRLVPSVIEECGRSSVKSAVILSSGFREMGEKGKKTEEMILKTSKETELRVLGPNCMGIYNNAHDFNGTYFWELPRIKGNISFISQSGAYGGICFNQVRERKIGISKFVSIGNTVDIDHTDCIEYLGKDEATRVIALFIEGLQDGRKFLEVSSHVSKIKPIVAFKAGRSQVGSRATLSHTGSIAGAFEVYQAAFKQAGVILVQDTEEFFDITMALSACSRKLPSGNRVAIMGISGGPSVSASDLCEEIGLSVPLLDDSLRAKLKVLTPEFSATSNPVDMTPQTDPRNYWPCADLVFGEKGIDGGIALNAGLDNEEFAQAFGLASEKYSKPVLSFTIDTPKITSSFHKMGIPVYPTPERAVRAYHGLVRYSEILKKPYEWHDSEAIGQGQNRFEEFFKSSRNRMLDEFHSKIIFKRYGIPVCREAVVSTLDEALQASSTLGYPVALKLCSDGVIHKTELGGVIPHLKNSGEVSASLNEMSSKFGKGLKYLVQEWVYGQVEVIVGGKRDPVFGPTIIFGIGGILTELLRDFSLRICPIHQKEAEEMVEEIRGFPLLNGYRGRQRLDINRIVDVLMKVCKIMMENKDIAELDINPLIVSGDKVTAVDGLIIFK